MLGYTEGKGSHTVPGDDPAVLLLCAPAGPCCCKDARARRLVNRRPKREPREEGTTASCVEAALAEQITVSSSSSDTADRNDAMSTACVTDRGWVDDLRLERQSQELCLARARQAQKIWALGTADGDRRQGAISAVIWLSEEGGFRRVHASARDQ